MIKTFGNTEILQVADAVSREKSIPRELIISALEETIKAAAKKKYGPNQSLKVIIDRKTGEIKIYRQLLVIPDDENYIVERNPNESDEEYDERCNMEKIFISMAIQRNSLANIGDFMQEQLPPLDLNRFLAQVAKHTITSKLKEIELDKQYEEFKNKIGEVITGIVDKVEFGNLVVRLGHVEAWLGREHLLKTDHYKQGDKIKAYLFDIDRTRNNTPQILLSRTDPKFVEKLFHNEIPEIQNGIIEVKAVARDASSRSKIAVYSMDLGIDPIGSCIGIKGSRIQAIVGELKGEKIDVIRWSSDPAKFLINALTPIEVAKVILDEDKHRIEVILAEQNQNIVIGRRGQNVKLLAELIGWDIIVMTQAEESSRKEKSFESSTKILAEALDLDEMLAQLLVLEGYNKIDDISSASISDLTIIKGIDENIANELILRAKEHQEKIIQTYSVAAVVNNDLLEVLLAANIKTLENLADLDNQELIEILSKAGKDTSRVDEIIMEARAKLGFFK